MKAPTFLACTLLLALSSFHSVWAHHDLEWDFTHRLEITGTVVYMDIADPHSLMALRQGEKLWKVEIGTPWTQAKAGLKPALLMSGKPVTVRGYAAAGTFDAAQWMVAESLVIDGQEYSLFEPKGVYK